MSNSTQKLLKEMRYKMKDIIVESDDLDILDSYDSDITNKQFKSNLYKGIYQFTHVDIKVVRLTALKEKELVLLTRLTSSKKSFY